MAARAVHRVRFLSLCAIAVLCIQATYVAPVAAASPFVTNQSTAIGTGRRADGGAVKVTPAPIRMEPTAVAGESDEPLVTQSSPSVARPPKARTELQSKRTEKSLTYANPDGSYTLVVSTGRLNFKDASGTWQPINLALVDDAVGAFSLRGSANDVTTRFGTVNAEAGLAQIAVGADVLTIRAIGYGQGSAIPAGQSVLGSSPTDIAPDVATPAPSASPDTGTAQGTIAATPSPAPSPEATAAASPSLPSLEPAPTPKDTPSAVVTPSPTSSPLPVPANTPLPSPALAPGSKVAAPGQGHNATVWAQPLDSGLEFGATFPDSKSATAIDFALDVPPGDVARLDGSAVVVEQYTLDGSGSPTVVFVGRVSTPVLYEGGGVDGAVPIVDRTVTSLTDQGNGKYVIRYELDADWFHDPERVFPIVLDPTICLRAGGGTGCTTGDTHYANTYIGQGQPTTYPTTPSTLRAGLDAIGSPDAAWGTLRSLVSFDLKDFVNLTDAQQVSAATLTLREDNNRHGTTNAGVYAYLLSKGFTNTTTWNDINAKTVAGYGGVKVNACAATTTDCDLAIDVTDILAANLSKNPASWKGGWGFMIQAYSESTWDEIDFYTGQDATVSNRPRLSITYVTPAVALDFDSSLGPTYSPSTMAPSVPTVLPIVVSNKAATTIDKCTSTSDLDCYQLGYRWFNGKGRLVSSTSFGAMNLIADIAAGAITPTPLALAITPPASIGQYTLRLDLVHRIGGSAGTLVWASDFADPSKYYARNKKVLASDGTRWTGISLIERDEFTITVGSGDIAADPHSAAGMSIDLATRNLAYTASTGLGFGDLVPIGLDYAYSSADATNCTGYLGILGACGWSTSWDERVTGGPNQTGYDYIYQTTAGARYVADTDADGQLVSGAPVLLERPRVTIADETKPAGSGITQIDPTSPFEAFSGSLISRAPSNASTGLGAPSTTSPVGLNTYSQVRFAMRTDSATSTGLCIKIHNVSDASLADPRFTDSWFCYTAGSPWNPGSFENIDLGGSIVGAWTFYSRNLWNDVRNNGTFGGPLDEYQVIAMQIQSAGAVSGSTYIDALRLEPVDSSIVYWNGTTINKSPTTLWTAGGGLTAESDDAPYTGEKSLKVTAASYGSSPLCNTTGSACWGTSAGGLWSYAFSSWSWKKVGGQLAAITMWFNDETAGVTGGAITYYAGPVAPAGVPVCPGTSTPCVVQVSPTVPTTWTKVTRNILEDARQILGMYTDAPSETRAAGPNDVRLVGYRITGGDGNFLLLGGFRFGGLPDVARQTRTGTADEYAQPDVAGEAVQTYDFRATYADGTVHYFNDAGLLARIVDLDGNTLSVDWTIDPTKSGQAAYTLDRIRAASDGLSLSTGTANRELVMAKSVAGGATVYRFDENLGSTTSDASGRAATFRVSTTTSDLVSVAPARLTDQTCTAAPSGCFSYIYDAASPAHRLVEVRDPRYDPGATPAVLYATGITWAQLAGDSVVRPTQITDKAAGNAVLLNVVAWDHNQDGSPLYRRPLYQDATAMAAGNVAIHEELSPDGAVRATYAPQACSGTCSTLTAPGGLTSDAAHPDQGLDHLRVSAVEFDGIAHVSKTTTYRCNQAPAAGSGCTGAADLLSVTRQGSNAGATVDSVANPLAGGGPAWTQTADQYFASMRDSGGTNPDLYRTEMTYDGYGEPIETRTLATNQGANSGVAAVSGATAPMALYSLNGNPNDAVGGVTGSPSGITYAAGALRFSADQAAVFNGSATLTAAIPSQTAGYGLEAWVKVTAAGVTGKGILGRFLSNSGAMVLIDSNGYFALAHNAARVVTAVKPEPNRWYYVAATWDGATGKVYVDGRLAASGAVTGATGTGGATFEFGAYGNAATGTKLSGSIDEAAIYSSAPTASDIRNRFNAARAVAEIATRTAIDRAGHRVGSIDSSLVNGDFEGGLTGWKAATGSPSVYAAASSSDANVHVESGAPAPSWVSIALPTGAAIRQDAQLVPGQTVRFQAWHKSAGSASWTVSWFNGTTWSSTWNGTSVTGTSTAAGWTGEAWDLTLPMRSDGRIRIDLAGAGAGTTYVDDVVLVTAWARTGYNQLGLATTSATLPIGSIGGVGSLPVVTTSTAYTPSSVAPAIYPTTVIANDVATPGGDPANDATTSMTYDAWGRRLVTIDPDGIVSATPTYGANQTDVTSVTDALNHTTSYTYDLAGRVLTESTPLGLVTRSTYDQAGRRVMLAAPDGTKSATIFNAYGEQTAVIANNGDGTGSGASGVDDVASRFAYDAMGRQTKIELDCGDVAGSCTANGGIDATTSTALDLTGAAVATTTYPGSGGTGTPRSTTEYFETFTYTPSGSPATTLTRLTPSGVRNAIAPAASPAPQCPGTGSTFCSSASLTKALNGISVPGIDFNGQTLVTVDAYGNISRTWHDVQGRTVRTIATYDDGDPATGAADRDLVSDTQYSLAGLVVQATDASNRSLVSSYDALGRVTKVTRVDRAGVDTLASRTIYTSAGRVDRESGDDAPTKLDGARTWSKSVYDALGRLAYTLLHYDATGSPGYAIDPFEDGDTVGWAPAGTGASVASDATVARSGTRALKVTPGSSGTGTTWTLSGTFLAGTSYSASAQVFVPSGSTITGTFGGGTPVTVAAAGWQPLVATLVVGGTNVTNPVFTITSSLASTPFWVDDAQAWMTADPTVNLPTGLVARDADGRVTASIMVPGVPGDPAMVTTTGYNAVGQPVIVSVNSAHLYGGTILAESSLTHYWPLDEASGSVLDAKGTLPLASVSAAVRGRAGLVDEGRTATGFAGSASYVLNDTAAASTATDNFSLEAWIQADALPAAGQLAIAAYNGNDLGGWGIGIDATGAIVALYGGRATLATTAVITTGTLHHLVLVRSGGVAKIYVDGTAYTPSNSTTAPIAPTAHVTIGGEIADTRDFAGTVDEVAVYSAALSATQVSSHFAIGHRTDASSNLTSRTSYDPLGRATDASDARTIRTHAVFDRLGRQIDTYANYRSGTPIDGTSDDSDVRSRYAYDALGELVAYCPARAVASADACDPTSTNTTSNQYKSAWHYGFDAMGRPTTTVPPVPAGSATPLATSETVYEAGGRVAKTCAYPAALSCAGTTATRTQTPTYDALGRVLTMTTTDNGTTVPALTRTSTYNTDGSPASLSRGGDTVTFGYDDAGRQVSTSRGGNVLTGVEYDVDGTILRRVDHYLDGATTATTGFTYDWARREITASNSAFASNAATAAYRLDGLLAARTYPTSPTEALSLAYDAAKRPLTITRANGDTITRTYDRAGNTASEARVLAGISGNAGSGTQTFTYDSLNRLTGSSGLSTSKSYQYDLDGNRTVKVEGATTTSYTYDRTDQLLGQSTGSLSFVYDAFGNMTSKAETLLTVTSFAYDAANRLTTITPAAGAGTTATFTFDALDRIRTRTLGTGPAESYGYLGATDTAIEVSSVTGGVTTATRSLLDLDGSRLALKTGSTVSWTLFDELGSLIGLESASRAVTDARRYDCYGETIASVAPTTDPWRFRGSLDVSPTTDPLYAMGARLYAPSVGTFTQLDTFAGSAQHPASMNRFLYAEGNPATFIDPTGHMVSQNQLCGRYADFCGDNSTPATRQHPDTSKPANGGGCGTSCGGSTSGGSVDPSWTSAKPKGAGAPAYIDPDVFASSMEWNQLLDQTSYRCSAGAMPDESACDLLDALHDFQHDQETAFCATHNELCRARRDETVLLAAGGVEAIGTVIAFVDLVPGDEVAMLTADGATASRLGEVQAEIAAASSTMTRSSAIQSDLAIAESHLLNETDDGLIYGPNAAMLSSIRTAIQDGRPLSQFERTFLDHELLESSLMSESGMTLEDAHRLVLQVYKPGTNYSPTIMEAFPDHFNNLERANVNLPTR